MLGPVEPSCSSSGTMVERDSSMVTIPRNASASPSRRVGLTMLTVYIRHLSTSSTLRLFDLSSKMNALLRDRQPTVVHIDTELIRATKGLQEYFARPPVVRAASSTFCHDCPADNDRFCEHAMLYPDPRRLAP
jgi:hypothetical protein